VCVDFFSGPLSQDQPREKMGNCLARAAVVAEARAETAPSLPEITQSLSSVLSSAAKAHNELVALISLVKTDNPNLQVKGQ